MDYFSIKETVALWRISPRIIQVLYSNGRINGADRIGNM